MCVVAISITSCQVDFKSSAHLGCLLYYIVILLLSFESSLHILDTHPLSGALSISFPILDCFFILLIESFEEQKLLILMKPNLSNF